MIGSKFGMQGYSLTYMLNFALIRSLCRPSVVKPPHSKRTKPQHSVVVQLIA